MLTDSSSAICSAGSVAAAASLDIRGSSDIVITRAHWRGISKESERVLQEHGDTKIQGLGANLSIVLTTPVGETRCEIPLAQQGSPVIPEKSNLQSLIVWMLTGNQPRMLEGDRMIAVSAAAALGFSMLQKPVSDLKFD